jgi:hypothetical protein
MDHSLVLLPGVAQKPISIITVAYPHLQSLASIGAFIAKTDEQIANVNIEHKKTNGRQCENSWLVNTGVE